MYIKYENVIYPCKCRPAATMVYRGLPENFPAPVDGEIELCANNGFVMRTDHSVNYNRQTFDGGVLTLTNTPEPAEPEPASETATAFERLEAQVLYTALMTDTLIEEE